MDPYHNPYVRDTVELSLRWLTRKTSSLPLRSEFFILSLEDVSVFFVPFRGNLSVVV